MKLLLFELEHSLKSGKVDVCWFKHANEPIVSVKIQPFLWGQPETLIQVWVHT